MKNQRIPDDADSQLLAAGWREHPTTPTNQRWVWEHPSGCPARYSLEDAYDLMRSTKKRKNTTKEN